MSDASRPSFLFADGVLQIDTPLAKMRLRGKPTPSAEELVPGIRRWRPFWPEFRLLRAEDVTSGALPRLSVDLPKDDLDGAAMERKSQAFAAFRAEVPKDMAHVVAPFKSHQWPLLILLHEQPRAMDLVLSNPVLAYCLANNNLFRGTHIDAAGVQAIGYSHRKQRTILAWLGFPGTESMVRLLRRIPPSAASPPLLRCLRNAVKDAPEMMDMLAHLREINEAVLELVVFWRIRDLITPRLLHEVSQLDGDHGEMAPGDIIHMGMEILGEIKSRRRIRPFTSLAQVYRFQEKMDALYQQYVWRQEEARRLIEEARARRQEEQRVRRERAREKRSEMAKRPFPPPPIPGTEHIIPLTSREELKQEGRQQSNCVGSYSSRVLSGDTYIYRVLKPERATLSIVYRADGCWRRSQLKTKGNRAVRPETIRLVDSWLGAYRLSI